MELILRDDVKNLGLTGEVVEVNDGYARNFLLPNQMAVRATEANQKQYQAEREKLEEKREEKESRAQELADQIKTLELEMEKNASEEGSLYGSVSQSEISEKLQEKGYDQIDSRQIIIDNAINEVGEFSVRIQLFESVEAEVDLEVVPT